MTFQSAPPPRMEPITPRRRGAPWWVWLLSGCAGCAVLMVVISVAVGVYATKAVQDATNVGPVNPVTVAQSLGPDVPLYPGAQLDETVTRTMLSGYRMGEKLAGKPAGSMFKGVAYLTTPDPVDKVRAFYKQQLGNTGWTSTSAASDNEPTYQKNGETVSLQIGPNDTDQTKTDIMITRGRFDGNAPPTTPPPTAE